MRSDQAQRSVLSFKGRAIQFFFLCLYFSAVAGIIHLSAASANVANEGSLIEVMQLAFLLLISSTFGLVARYYRDYRWAGLLFAAFFLCLAIRELDHLLDQVFHGFWKYPAWFVALSALTAALWKRELSCRSLQLMMCCRSFTLMLVGIALLLVFSRLYGMSELWHRVMDEVFIRDVKNISEEAMELLAYAVILLAAFSCWLELSAMARSKPPLN